MRINKEFETKIKEAARRKNFSIYDIHLKYGISTVSLSRIFNGYLPIVSKENQEKLKEFIEDEEDPLEENTDQRIKRKLTKLLEIFKTRVNIAKHIGVGVSQLTKVLSGARAVTSKRLVNRIDEVYKELEKDNFSLGEFDIDEYIKTHAYKDIKQEELVDTKRLAERDNLEARKLNRRIYKPLQEGKAYEVSIDKYDDSEEQETIQVVVLEEFRRFYLVASPRGLKTTVLKSNLYLATTKVKKLN